MGQIGSDFGGAAKAMGMGNLADPGTIFKRKFRWGLTIEPNCKKAGKIQEWMVKVAARPNLSIEETEIHMKHGKMYIPGKATWETMTVTFYDVTGKNINNDISALYGWIISVYDITSKLNDNLYMGDSVNAYGGKATLVLYSGCGVALEQWLLDGCWPSAINWNDLDYSSSEECTIEMTLRYSMATYSSTCLTAKGGCCTDCQ